MNKMCSTIPLLAALSSCRTRSALDLFTLQEGGELYASDAMTSYIRHNVSFDVTVQPHGGLELEVTNHGDETVAIAPDNVLWVLHCDDNRWLPLQNHSSASSTAPVFLSSGESRRIVGSALLQGLVLSPGHHVQAFYYGSDGKIIRASQSIPCDDALSARLNEDERRHKEKIRASQMRQLQTEPLPSVEDKELLQAIDEYYNAH